MFCQPCDFDYCFRQFDLFDLTHCDVQLTALYFFGPLSFLTVLIVYSCTTLISVKLQSFLVFVFPCKSYSIVFLRKDQVSMHEQASPVLHLAGPQNLTLYVATGKQACSRIPMQYAGFGHAYCLLTGISNRDVLTGISNRDVLNGSCTLQYTSAHFLMEKPWQKC